MAQFCSNCGEKLDDNDRFCKSCGKSLVEKSVPKREMRTKRKVVYEGIVHNCPCCESVIESFMTKCPFCGYEIRDAIAPTSVTELSLKLERVQARQMSDKEDKNSLMKMLIGADFKDEKTNEKIRKFEEQKNKEKANIIINFPVPNTKEDILEFMILATSNINVKESSDEVTKAWIKKMEQVYQRAKLTLKTSNDFEQIKCLYNNKKVRAEKPA